jgi:hypothetical protein
MPRRDGCAVDPDEQRYRRNYPRFPGVAETVQLLKLGGTRGGYLEAVLGDLREHAPEVLDDVTNAVDEEVDQRIRTLLVAELAEVADHRLIAFFASLLDDANESVAHWAELGLELIDTKQARTVLFQQRGPDQQRHRRHHGLRRQH